MKRIAVVQFYFYPDISAVSQLLGDLLCRLSESGDFEITVYCATSDYSEIRNQQDERFSRLNIVRIRTPNIGRSTLAARAFDFLGYYIAVFFRVLFHRGLDVVVSMSSPPLVAFPVSLALLLRKARFIYYLEDLFPEILFDMGYLKRPWIIRRLQGLNRFVMGRADRIVTLGRFMSRKVALGYPQAAGKIVEIPNWTRNIDFAPKAGTQELILMYTGNMGVAHDFSLLGPLIRALASLEGIRYHFSGGGARFFDVQSIFQAEGESRFTLEGYSSRSEHESALARADVFIISQRREAVGNLLPSKLYSYLAAGRPMIFLGPRASEIGSIIIENDLGVVVEHLSDVQTVRRYIEFLRRDPSRAAGIQRRARRFSDQCYGLEKSARRFRELLEGQERVAG